MADNGIRQETIQCSRCKKRFFEDGFRVNRLGRRNKTCLECNAKKKAEVERAKQNPEKVAKMKVAGKVRWERIKNDPERLAARRLQQNLTWYKHQFPNDPHQPTTQKEIDDRREWHRLAYIVKNGIGNGTLQRHLDVLEQDKSPQQSKDLAAKLRTMMIELKLGF